MCAYAYEYADVDMHIIIPNNVLIHKQPPLWKLIIFYQDGKLSGSLLLAGSFLQW